MSREALSPPGAAELNGRSVVLAYGSVAEEYGALHRGAALFDRSHRGRLRVSGPRATEMVNGLVTNDLGALEPGHGCYAAALTAKGKIVADLRAFVLEDGVLTDTPARASAAWSAMVRKYVNPRLAPSRDETSTLRALGIYGVNARHVASEVTGVLAPALTALAPYAHLSLERDGASVLVARTPDLGVEGFELVVPAETFDSWWERSMQAGAVPAGLEAWEIARVEAGRPEWGLDMDDSTLPQEANLEELHAISFTKGCYVGQETVARVHFRGHVNRHLRGIRPPLDDGAAPEIVRGATLHTADGTLVGDVRTSVRSPRLGAVALAMVRREVPVGTPLRARWPGPGGAEHPAEQAVEVVALPFGGA